MAILVCQNCGKETVTTLFRLNAGQKYCSTKCKNESMRTTMTPKRVKVFCLQCGREYIIPRAWEREGRRKFCSRTCKNRYQKTLTGEKAAHYGKTHTSESRDKISRTRVARGSMQKKENHPNWKGGRAFHGGYVNVMIDILPEEQKQMARLMRPKQGYILEHRLVMAMVLGRPLTRAEIVHHINGNPSDNQAENLMVEARDKHSQEHREFVRRIGELEAENARLKFLLETYQKTG